MPSINMIAPRRAEKRRLERDVRRLVLVICVELILGILVSGALWARIYNTHARATDLEVQLSKLQPEVRKIETLQAQTKDLQPKLDLLRSAKVSTLHWYNLLDKLSRSMPEKTWVRRIDSSQPAPEKPESQIVLNGVAQSQRLVGDLMLSLYTNPDLGGVELRYTQATDVGKRPVYEFEVAASLKTSLPDQKGVNASGNQKS